MEGMTQTIEMLKSRLTEWEKLLIFGKVKVI